MRLLLCLLLLGACASRPNVELTDALKLTDGTEVAFARCSVATSEDSNTYQIFNLKVGSGRSARFDPTFEFSKPGMDPSIGVQAGTIVHLISHKILWACGMGPQYAAFHDEVMIATLETALSFERARTVDEMKQALDVGEKRLTDFQQREPKSYQ